MATFVFQTTNAFGHTGTIAVRNAPYDREHVLAAGEWAEARGERVLVYLRPLPESPTLHNSYTADSVIYSPRAAECM